MTRAAPSPPEPFQPRLEHRVTVSRVSVTGLSAVVCFFTSSRRRTSPLFVCGFSRKYQGLQKWCKEAKLEQYKLHVRDQGNILDVVLHRNLNVGFCIWLSADDFVAAIGWNASMVHEKSVSTPKPKPKLQSFHDHVSSYGMPCGYATKLNCHCLVLL